MAKFKRVILEVSRNCNLRCIMCGYGKEQFDPAKFMTFDHFTALVGKLAPHTLGMRLNGRGESTIHPQFCDMVAYMTTHFPKVGLSLFTNLNFKSDAVIEALLAADIQLSYSVDSPDKTTLEYIRRGAKYETVLSNMEKLKCVKRPPIIVFTIQQSNCRDILPIAEFAVAHSCHIIYNAVRGNEEEDALRTILADRAADIFTDLNRAKQYIEASGFKTLVPEQILGFKSQYDYWSVNTSGGKARCQNLDDELCVAYNGDVTPCNMFNPWLFGNLLEESLEHILNGERRAAFLAAQSSDEFCKNCACMSK